MLIKQLNKNKTNKLGPIQLDEPDFTKHFEYSDEFVLRILELAKSLPHELDEVRGILIFLFFFFWVFLVWNFDLKIVFFCKFVGRV